jgi:hypothetical protein
MRKLILAVALLAVAVLAIGATLVNRPVAEALARAEGYSYPATPNDHSPARTAEAARADARY